MALAQPGGAVGGPPGRANPLGQPRITARQRAALRVESLWVTSWDRRITGRKTQLDSDHVLLESLLRALWRKEAGRPQRRTHNSTSSQSTMDSDDNGMQRCIVDQRDAVS